MVRSAFAFAACLLVSACSADEAAPSPEENRQLDSAENLLDEAPDQLNTVGETLPERE